ncbi:hypothetical protein ABK040_009947 [Willaertia magna]
MLRSTIPHFNSYNNDFNEDDDKQDQQSKFLSSLSLLESGGSSISNDYTFLTTTTTSEISQQSNKQYENTISGSSENEISHFQKLIKNFHLQMKIILCKEFSLFGIDSKLFIQINNNNKLNNKNGKKINYIISLFGFIIKPFINNYITINYLQNYFLENISENGNCKVLFKILQQMNEHLTFSKNSNLFKIEISIKGLFEYYLNNNKHFCLNISFLIPFLINVTKFHLKKKKKDSELKMEILKTFPIFNFINNYPFLLFCILIKPYLVSDENIWNNFYNEHLWKVYNKYSNLIYLSSLQNTLQNTNLNNFIKKCNAYCNLFSKLENAKYDDSILEQTSFNVYFICLLSDIFGNLPLDNYVTTVDNTLDNIPVDNKRFSFTIIKDQIYFKKIKYNKIPKIDSIGILNYILNNNDLNLTIENCKLYLPNLEHFLFDAIRTSNFTIISFFIENLKDYNFINFKNKNKINILNLNNIISIIDENNLKIKNLLKNFVTENDILRINKLGNKEWNTIFSFRAFSLNMVRSCLCTCKSIYSNLIKNEELWKNICIYYFRNENLNLSLKSQLNKLYKFGNWRQICKIWTQFNYFYLLDENSKNYLKLNKILLKMENITLFDCFQIIDLFEYEYLISIFREDVLIDLRNLFKFNKINNYREYNFKIKKISLQSLFKKYISKLNIFKQKWNINFLDCFRYLLLNYFVNDNNTTNIENNNLNCRINIESELVCYVVHLEEIIEMNFQSTIVILYNSYLEWIGMFELF